MYFLEKIIPEIITFYENHPSSLLILKYATVCLHEICILVKHRAGIVTQMLLIHMAQQVLQRAASLKVAVELVATDSCWLSLNALRLQVVDGFAEHIVNGKQILQHLDGANHLLAELTSEVLKPRCDLLEAEHEFFKIILYVSIHFKELADILRVIERFHDKLPAFRHLIDGALQELVSFCNHA